MYSIVTTYLLRQSCREWNEGNILLKILNTFTIQLSFMIETSTDNSFQILTISKENGFKYYFVNYIKNKY